MRMDVKFTEETFAPKFGTVTEIRGGYSQAEVDSMVAAAEGAFWDAVQDYGNRKDYNRAFRQWGSEYIRPKYKVVPTTHTSAVNIFHENPRLKKIEAQYFDFSQKLTSNTTSSYSYFCANCPKLEEIEDVGIMPDATMQYAFYYCYKLHTIAKIRVGASTTFSSTFTRCDALENLTVEGTIGKNGFNVSWSPLTRESLLSIINALETKTDGGSWSITLGSENMAKLTEAELSAVYAKGWSVA